jgi:transposase
MTPLDEGLIHDVVRLDRDGMSWRAIARALKISRNTVRQLLHEHRRVRQHAHSALPAKRSIERPSKLDPFRAHIDELFRTYPDITAQRVFERLRDAGFDGGYTVV